MTNQTLNTSELIYEAKIQFTGMVDYGISMEALSSGKMEIPPGGARFDQTFQGILQGPTLNGKIAGTDYLNIRSDGSFQLHLHGRITTQDGVNISISSTGVSLQIEGGKDAQIRSAVSLFTSSKTYQWLNQLQLWALGSMDPMNGKAVIRAYNAR